jgi:hypothetical protein
MVENASTVVVNRLSSAKPLWVEKPTSQHRVSVLILTLITSHVAAIEFGEKPTNRERSYSQWFWYSYMEAIQLLTFLHGGYSVLS